MALPLTAGGIQVPPLGTGQSTQPGLWITTEGGLVITTEGGTIITTEPQSQTYAPLQAIIEAYPYLQYSDDINIVAFFDAYNEIAQGYLEWFNNTALALYTSTAISGQLLDWIGQGIYGVNRPVFISISPGRYIAGLAMLPVGIGAVSSPYITKTDAATLANDDYYKRVLTWTTYVGNGRYFNIEVLRMKVARFLYGVNGSDVTINYGQNVHIQAGAYTAPPAPTLTSIAGGALSEHIYSAQTTYVSALGETLPSPPTTLLVEANHLLVVDSPPAYAGLKWNSYVGVIETNPGKFIAGVGTFPVGYQPVGGTNNRGVVAPTRQNSSAMVLGNTWTEPTSGLIAGAPLPTSDTSNPATNFIISVPTSTAAQYLSQLFEFNLLPFPFQLSAMIVQI